MSGQLAAGEDTPTPGDTMDVSHPFTLATDSEQSVTLTNRRQLYLLNLCLLITLAVLGSLAATFALSTMSETKMGGLLLTSQPGTDIELTLNGQSLPSRSAIAVGNLESGEHVVTAQRGHGKPQKTSFKLGPMDFRAVNFDLRTEDDRKASFTVKVVPSDAKVKLDGVPTTKVNKIVLNVGSKAVLEVSREGYVAEKREVMVRNTEARTLVFDLEPILGTMFISSEPNATVYINGRKRGRTPVQLKEMDTNEDWHIRLVAAEHKAYEGTHRFDGTRIMQVDKALLPE